MKKPTPKKSRHKRPPSNATLTRKFVEAIIADRDRLATCMAELLHVLRSENFTPSCFSRVTLEHCQAALRRVGKEVL